MVLVKKPCIEISLHGERIAERVDWISKKYEFTVLTEEPEDASVSIESTDYWMELEKNRVGNLLAAARLNAGLTQARLAEKLGIRQNMVSDYERGRRACSNTMAKRLSKALKVDEEHLTYGEAGKSIDGYGSRHADGM